MSIAFASALLNGGVGCGDWGCQSGTGEESAEDDVLELHFGWEWMGIWKMIDL